MLDDPRRSADPPPPPAPPAAIRITRPYASEEEYLSAELETLTRTSITLLGAQPRPQGVVLRFELVIASGQALVRGEGRVVGFKANAQHGLGGLTLRFTRLDSRSKALVDRAATLREKRRSSAPPAPGSEPPTAAASGPAIPRDEPTTGVSVRLARAGLPHPDRDALLERLRTRAKSLDPGTVDAILATRRRV